MKAAIGLLICCCAVYVTVTEANYGCPIRYLCRAYCRHIRRCHTGRCRGWIRTKCKCYGCRRSNQGDVIEEFPSDEVTEEFQSDEFTEEFPTDEVN